MTRIIFIVVAVIGYFTMVVANSLEDTNRGSIVVKLVVRGLLYAPILAFLINLIIKLF